MSDTEKIITCGLHGKSYATFICQHLARSSCVGFYYGSEDDIRPDAWCHECDQILMRHGGEWNDETESSADIKLACAGCYDTIRLQNETPYKRIPPQNRPTIEEDGWELMSAVRMNMRYPQSFKIPLESEIKSLQQNNLVKLLFAFAEEDNTINFERMWVKIIEVDGDGFTGILETNPIEVGELQTMTKIKFEYENVASVIKRPAFSQLIKSLFSSRKFKLTPREENEAYN